jgi:hypothetical protein
MAGARGWWRPVCLAGILSVGVSYCVAQAIGQSQPAPATAPAVESQPSTSPAATPASQPEAVAANPSREQAAPRKTYTVPAGTKVLLQLTSAINSRSAQPGDGVYLRSIFPVVVGNRVMIPTGVYVQGVVDRVQRGGRIKGKAQLEMHFTSIIFPNGSVVEVPAVVDSMPGAKSQTVKDDGEGTIEQNGDKGRNAGQTAEIALPTGAGVGTIGGARSGHPIQGGLAGVGAGLATVGIVTLFTRNADLNIPVGTQVEMVLQRPLVLEEANLAGPPGTAPELVPASGQQRPITSHHPRIMCPPGSLGCE